MIKVCELLGKYSILSVAMGYKAKNQSNCKVAEVNFPWGKGSRH